MTSTLARHLWSLGEVGGSAWPITSAGALSSARDDLSNKPTPDTGAKALSNVIIDLYVML
jgi:hypothetical protein